LWIPSFGYVGASWATFVCYFVMVVVSYVLGQKNYPIAYDLKKIIGYPLLVAIIVAVYSSILPMDGAISWVLKVLIILLFIAFVYLLEVRKKKLFSRP